MRTLYVSIIVVALTVTMALTASPQATRPTLQVAFSIDPVTVDPRLQSNFPGESIVRTFYEPLINHDRKGDLIPVLAESWRVVDDKILEFKLRRGVKFHNGENFDADSVKYTIETIIAPDSRSVNRHLLADIVRIETPDPYTVRLVTGTPVRPLLSSLTFWPIGLMPPKASRELGQRTNTVAVGTGPYKLVEYTPGQQVVVEANDAYWGKKPSYSRIVFKIIPENGARLAALESGEVMMINNVPPDQIDRINGTPNLRIVSTPTARIMFVALNMGKPVMQDARLRQAMNYAIDRNAIVKNLLRGMTDPARSPLPSMVSNAANFDPVPYDPAKAKELMTQAGYKGETLQFYVPNGRYLMDKQIGEAIAGYLERAGFKVSVQIPEWGKFASEAFGRGTAWDMAFWGYGVVTLDPDMFFRPLFHSKFSFIMYDDGKVDALINLGRSVFDQQKVRITYRLLQEYLWKEVPVLFLYLQPQVDAVNTRLKGYTPTPDEFMMFTGTSLEGR